MEHFDLGNTMGALMIGVVVSSCLFGVIIVQTFYYFMTYNDPLVIRCTVWILLYEAMLHLTITSFILYEFRALETVHTALSAHGLYYFTIHNYNNPAALLVEPLTGVVVIVFSTAIKLVVQLFYTRRVWNVSNKNVFLCGFLLLFGIGNFGVSISVSLAAFRDRHFSKLQADLGPIDTALIQYREYKQANQSAYGVYYQQWACNQVHN
ncbi:hypothetical protein HGRIS_007357 [Hohenbuehelia grisea]|uniref:Uncharacterized protein n=1 Tax=Hohenbuehelia grisea TaxID=104357 RepID=A0ABR3J504_9AGAR